MAARVMVVVEAHDAASGVLRGLTSQFGAFGGMIEELTAKNVNWGNVSQMVTQMVINGVREIIGASAEAEEAHVRLAGALEATGRSAEMSAEQIEKTSESLMRMSTFDDEAISNAAVALSQFDNIDTDQFEAITKAAMDMTAVLGGDLAGNAEAVGRALETGVIPKSWGFSKALKANIQDMIEEGKSGEALQSILDELSSRFGGQALNALTTYTGATKVLSNEWGNLMENGQTVLPVLTQVKLALADLLVLAQLNSGAQGEMNNGEVQTLGELQAQLAMVNEQIERANTYTEKYILLQARNQLLTKMNNKEYVDLGGSVDNMTASYQKVNSVMLDTEDNARAITLAEAGLVDENGDVTSAMNALERVAQNLKVGLSGDFLKAHEDYDTRMVDLKADAADLTGQLEALRKRGVKESSDDWQNLTKKLQENKKAQDELEAATKKTVAQMLYQQVATHLDAEGQLELARQLGLISEQDYAISEAIQKVTDKYDTNRNGVIEASEATGKYITEIGRLKQYLDALPENVSSNVILNFVVNGTPPSGYDKLPLCFIEGTPVHMSDGTQKPIQNIEEGDLVLSYDLDTKTKIPAFVGKVFRHAPEEMNGGYYLLINGYIGVTLEHPFYVKGEWICAGSLKAGDSLFGVDGKPVIVETINLVYGPVKTYNLEVEHTHTYFANGVLVHNKLQSGGVAYAGVPTLVGEAGPEPFFPAVGGRVIGHAEALHALSLGGAGGSNLYFYGPVTIDPGADAGGDLLSMR